MLDSNPLEVTSYEELALRLGLAALVGLLLGLDREMRGVDAGIRTHALVALSSAMIMISSLLLYAELRKAGADAPDPLRAVQGLAQSIGFIAAGMIFVRGGAVRNMTTAANIWIAAAVGIACGCGQYALVLIGAGLALILLTALKAVERFLPGTHVSTGDDG
ncbi:MAG TPA: MgtC/SapB family protein [Allosphingosinicella sp.]|jgi:putative Mg2+ transporter-C (MgtC) family protein